MQGSAPEKRMKIRTLIVDDEPPARRGLRTLIEQDRSFEVVGECDDGESAVTAIERLAPDVVFLDIQMPGKNGFEVLNALQGKMPHIVFVTAFDRYAIEAFEIQALDYLLKPVNRARMKDSLLRVRERFLESESENLQRKFESVIDVYGRLQSTIQKLKKDEPATLAGGYQHKLLIKGKKKIFSIRTNDIDWIEAANDYVKIHVGEKIHLMRETMKKLEDTLDPAVFVRVHRSKIVNVEKVASMEPLFSGNYMIYLHDGTKLLSSRVFTKNLRIKLGGGRQQ